MEVVAKQVQKKMEDKFDKSGSTGIRDDSVGIKMEMASAANDAKNKLDDIKKNVKNDGGDAKGTRFKMRY